MENELRAAVLKALGEMSGSPNWFAIVRNGGCEQSFRNLLLCHLQRSVLDSIAFSEASIGTATRIDLILRRLSNLESVLCVTEVKFNYTTQTLNEIRKRLIEQAHSQLLRTGDLGNNRFCVYMIATLYAPDGTDAAIAEAHNSMAGSRNGIRLPGYKQFVRGDRSSHNQWMRDHHIHPHQLVNMEPVILSPVDAERDGSRAALSVAVIPCRDLEVTRQAIAADG